MLDFKKPDAPLVKGTKNAFASAGLNCYLALGCFGILFGISEDRYLKLPQQV